MSSRLLLRFRIGPPLGLIILGPLAWYLLQSYRGRAPPCKLLFPLSKECIVNNWRFCDPMPTAIFRYLTSSGLILAADGKVTDLVDRRNQWMNVQKIFEIRGTPAAYALNGNVNLGGEPELHIGQKFGELVNMLTPHPIPDLLAYAEDLAKLLYAWLLDAKAKELIPYFHGYHERGSRTTIAHILLFGYCKGTPQEVDIWVWHRDQVPGCSAEPFDFARHNPRPWGSPEVWNALLSGNPKFSKFMTTKIPPHGEIEQISLLDAAKIGESYIAACDSDEGRKLDPIMCPTIGGHVHIAAITQTCFHWLKPPIMS
jgi:hypothetical protein